MYHRKERLPIEINRDMGESTSIKGLIVPFRDKMSAQRVSLFLSQLANSILGIKTEVPIVASSMEQEIFQKMTIINKLKSSKIKLLKTFKYGKFRTIYIYETDDEITYLDTDNINKTNGFGQPLRTDLSMLEPGVEYSIPKNEDFYETYISQFDPKTKTFSYGSNVRCLINTDVENANDSFKVSQSFVEKFIAMRVKNVNLELKNETILSKYPKIFPELGEIITEPILLKAVNDYTSITSLAQSADIPSGNEDDVIFVEPNSYIHSIEVYCNEEISDEILEQHRLDLLKFRTDIYSFLCELKDDKFSDELIQLREKFRINIFRTEKTDINYPLIKLKIICLDKPEAGFKVSTRQGGKVTIQSVYPDGTYIDEYGRNIEALYPATSPVSRAIPSLWYEHHLSGISDLLDFKIKNKELTVKDKDKIFKMINEIMKVMNLQNEMEYTGFNADDMFEYLQHHRLRFQALPYSNGLSIESMEKIESIAKKYIGYQKVKCYTRAGKDDYIQMQDGDFDPENGNKFQVGMIYMFRDYHDIYAGNSSCGTPEINLKGWPTDKDSSRPDGRSLYSKQSAKIDIQALTYIINMATNESSDVIINSESEAAYSIKEMHAAIGIKIGFNDDEVDSEDNEEDFDIDFDTIGDDYIQDLIKGDDKE